MKTRSRLHRKEPSWEKLPALFVLFVTVAVARAASCVLESQAKDNPNPWIAGNLRNWQELELIPCRAPNPGGAQFQTAGRPLNEQGGKQSVLEVGPTLVAALGISRLWQSPSFP
jgi:hypothetical protein